MARKVGAAAVVYTVAGTLARQLESLLRTWRSIPYRVVVAIDDTRNCWFWGVLPRHGMQTDRFQAKSRRFLRFVCCPRLQNPLPALV